MEDDSETLYRRPQGYWAAFNKWWREAFAATAKRPDFASIERWWNENAATVWPDPACRPDVHDTRTHAKCMRTVETVREYFKQYRQLHRDKRPWQSRAVYVDKLPPQVLEAKRSRRPKRSPRVGHNDSDASMPNASAEEGQLLSTTADSATEIKHQQHMQKPAVQLTYPSTIVTDNSNSKTDVCNAFGLLLPGPQTIINNPVNNHSAGLYAGYVPPQPNLKGQHSMQAPTANFTMQAPTSNFTMQLPWALSVPQPCMNSTIPGQLGYPGNTLQSMQAPVEQHQQVIGNTVYLGNGQIRQPAPPANGLRVSEQGVDAAIAAELQASNELLNASGMAVFSLTASVQTAQHMTDMAFNLYACQAEQQGLQWNIINPSHPMWPVFEMRMAVSARQNAGSSHTAAAPVSDVSKLVAEAMAKTAAFVQASMSGMGTVLPGQQQNQQWQPQHGFLTGLQTLHSCASAGTGYGTGPSNSAVLPESSNTQASSGFRNLNVDQLVLPNVADPDSPSNVIARIAEFEKPKDSHAQLPVQALPFQALQIQNLFSDSQRADSEQQAVMNVAANPSVANTEGQACSPSYSVDILSQLRLMPGGDNKALNTSLGHQHNSQSVQNLSQHAGVLLPQPWQQQQASVGGANALPMHFSWPLAMSGNTGNIQAMSASSQHGVIQQSTDNQSLLVNDKASIIQLGARLRSAPENVLLQYSRFHPANCAQSDAQTIHQNGMLLGPSSHAVYKHHHTSGAVSQNLQSRQQLTQSASQPGLQCLDLLASCSLPVSQSDVQV